MLPKYSKNACKEDNIIVYIWMPSCNPIVAT